MLNPSDHDTVKPCNDVNLEEEDNNFSIEEVLKKSCKPKRRACQSIKVKIHENILPIYSALQCLDLEPDSIHTIQQQIHSTKTKGNITQMTDKSSDNNGCAVPKSPITEKMLLPQIKPLTKIVHINSVQ